VLASDGVGIDLEADSVVGIAWLIPICGTRLLFTGYFFLPEA
jgi:hypothetical protein